MPRIRALQAAETVKW